jgi:hypothetical protein
LGVERGLEVMLTNFTFDWDITSRSKLLLISGDLLALGASVEEILALPTCAAVQQVRDPLEAHCWLFVVERVSNAHWAAYHQLDSVTREIGASYLRTMLTRRGWEQVCGAIERFSADEPLFEQLVANTDKAMREHYTWFAGEDDHVARAGHAHEEHAARRSVRFGRGSDNLPCPVERDAIPIVPATKRIDDPGDPATPTLGSSADSPTRAPKPSED